MEPLSKGVGPLWPKLKTDIDSLQDPAGPKLFEEFHSKLMRFYDDERKRYARSVRLRFDFDRDPEVGERAILWDGKISYFGARTSENWFQSGATTFQVATEGYRFVTLVECQNEVVDAYEIYNNSIGRYKIAQEVLNEYERTGTELMFNPWLASKVCGEVYSKHEAALVKHGPEDCNGLVNNGRKIAVL
jgi:hypothetical protein